MFWKAKLLFLVPSLVLLLCSNIGTMRHQVTKIEIERGKWPPLFLIKTYTSGTCNNVPCIFLFSVSNKNCVNCIEIFLIRLTIYNLKSSTSWYIYMMKWYAKSTLQIVNSAMIFLLIFAHICSMRGVDHTDIHYLLLLPTDQLVLSLGYNV